MKRFLNNSEEKITKADITAILIISICYSILSFINLGNNINPNTIHKADKTKSLIIELEKTEDIIKMKSFNGNLNANYQIYVSKDNKKYNYLTKVNGNGAFSWNETRLLTKGKYLKFLFIEDSTLGEIALYNNSKDLIKIKNITYNEKKINTLTDEYNTIPTQISYMNSSYFDEIYFARTAYEYVNGIETYEWTHPPLGKLIQAIPIYITKNMTPFNYRLMGNISGIIMIIVMYSFGKLLFKKRKYACLSSLLMCFDTFHFVETRIGTVDSHLILFILLATYFMFKFTKYSNTKDLFFSGLFFSFSISTKWTGFYGGIALAIIYFTHLIKSKRLNINYLFKGFSFFVIIPIIFYFSLYFLFPNNKIYYTNSVKKIIKQQEEMYKYHSSLESDHYFSSKWYTWPIAYKPVWYHNQIIDTNTRETISSVGNIVIWWFGIITTIYLLLKLLIKKDINCFYLLITILSLWIPYSLIKREMFLYHYFPVLPFIILTITNFFKDLENKIKVDFIIMSYLVFVVIFFIIYYPIVSGTPISNNRIENLKLFSSWYF